jgi:hypothetical protein
MPGKRMTRLMAGSAGFIGLGFGTAFKDWIVDACV